MHPTAKTCIGWAVGLFVAGTILAVWLPDLYLAIADRAGVDAQIGLDALLTVLDLVQRVAFPLGAALVGAAVVIQTLAPARQDAEKVASDSTA